MDILSAAPSTITLLTGTQQLTMIFDGLLAFFWESSLVDEFCDVCGQRFSTDSDTVFLKANTSIRTLSSLSKGWRIHNRHIGCIKEATIHYFSISHVWHPEVAMAHCQREQVTKANHTIYATITHILSAVSDKYGQDAEIWHDYVSVPQWRKKTQQALLESLPTIYATASRTFVHLSDVSVQSLDKILDQETTEQEKSDGVVEFLAAAWFTRMWVVLEWSRSRRANVLTREYEIRDGTDDMFWEKITAIWDDIARRFPGGKDALQKKYDGWTHPHVLAAAQRSKSYPTVSFGEALNIISLKNCREWRDRYTAIICFTGLECDPLPQDGIMACHALSIAALQMRDYTPLLLASEEGSIHESREYKNVPGVKHCGHWLRAYSKMTDLTWPCGDERAPADHPVHLEGSKVTMKLEYLGRIEWAEKYRFRGIRAERFAGVVKAATSIEDISFEDFVTSVAMRVYGRDHNMSIEDILSHARRNEQAIKDVRAKLLKLMSIRDASITSGIAAVIQDDPLEEQAMEDLQVSFQKLMFSYDISNAFRIEISIQEVAWELATLLDVAVNFSQAAHHGDMLHHEHFSMIGKVSCEICQKRLLFRFLAPELRNAIGATIYLIPGLKYGYTPWRGAVGLLVKERRIVGRIIYGLRGCFCKRVEIVEVD